MPTNYCTALEHNSKQNLTIFDIEHKMDSIVKFVMKQMIPLSIVYDYYMRTICICKKTVSKLQKRRSITILFILQATNQKHEIQQGIE